jgi:hypothetical protein
MAGLPGCLPPALVGGPACPAPHAADPTNKATHRPLRAGNGALRSGAAVWEPGCAQVFDATATPALPLVAELDTRCLNVQAIPARDQEAPASDITSQGARQRPAEPAESPGRPPGYSWRVELRPSSRSCAPFIANPRPGVHEPRLEVRDALGAMAHTLDGEFELQIQRKTAMLARPLVKSPREESPSKEDDAREAFAQRWVRHAGFAGADARPATAARAPVPVSAYRPGSCWGDADFGSEATPRGRYFTRCLVLAWLPRI